MGYKWRGKPWKIKDLSHLVATMAVVIIIPPGSSHCTLRMYIVEKNIGTRNTN